MIGKSMNGKSMIGKSMIMETVIGYSQVQPGYHALKVSENDYLFILSLQQVKVAACQDFSAWDLTVYLVVYF
jgi:hypothetical protein